MLTEKDIKSFKHFSEKWLDKETVEYVVAAAQHVSRLLEKQYRYACGLEGINILESGNGRGFFNSPDGQNGAYYYALRDAGFTHHFYKAEYHWGVRKGNIILTYTEGDIDVFIQPEGYKAPR